MPTLCVKEKMDIERIAEKLAEIDALETWVSYVPAELSQNAKKEVFTLAERLWLERMAKSGLLLLHPDVLDQLETQSWVATDLQKRMVWASVLASDESPDSKSRFKKIKKRLTSKYGYEWWEDTYRRIKPAFAAKNRINNQSGAHGPATSVFLNNTMLGAEIQLAERESALRMIPIE